MKIRILLLLLFWPATQWAYEASALSEALALRGDSRGRSLADAMTASFGEESGLNYNPALLTRGNGTQAQFAFFTGLAGQKGGSLSWAGAYKNWQTGLAFSFRGIEPDNIYNLEGTITGEVGVADFSGALSVAREIPGILSLGGRIKPFLFIHGPDRSQSLGWEFGSSRFFNIERLQLGLGARWQQIGKEGISSFGISLRDIPFALDLMYDFEYHLSGNMVHRIGTEYRIRQGFQFRIGYKTGFALGGLCGGIGFEKTVPQGKIRFDYSTTLITVSGIGQIHSLGITYFR